MLAIHILTVDVRVVVLDATVEAGWICETAGTDMVVVG